jgi:hypothetical protein
MRVYLGEAVSGRGGFLKDQVMRFIENAIRGRRTA